MVMVLVSASIAVAIALSFVEVHEKKVPICITGGTSERLRCNKSLYDTNC